MFYTGAQGNLLKNVRSGQLEKDVEDEGSYHARRENIEGIFGKIDHNAVIHIHGIKWYR